jgi:hypothetical protein
MHDRPSNYRNNIVLNILILSLNSFEDQPSNYQNNTVFMLILGYNSFEDLPSINDVVLGQ